MRLARIMILAAVLAIVAVSGVPAHNQLQPWNHASNAALLASSQRRWVELGITPVDLSADNSLLGFGDVFTETIVLDFPALAERLGDSWSVNAGAGASTYGTVHVGRIGAGAYVNVSNLSRVELPRGFIDLVADGAERENGDGPVLVDGSGAFVQRTFAEAGLYGSYRRGADVFAVKLGAYSPLIYSRDAEFAYDLYMHDEPNDDGNYVDFSAGASGEVLLGVNPDDPASDLAWGLNVDVGYLRRDDRRRALYGVGINNIPIVPAHVRYRIAEDLAFRIYSDDEQGFLSMLDEAENGGDPFTVEEPDLADPEVERLAEAQRVLQAPSVAGFYRFGVPVLDLIPHAEIVFGDLARVNAGLTVEGNVPVLEWVSVGMGRSDYSWQATAGLRIPLRIVELSTVIGFSAPELRNVFRAHGVTGRISIALGL